MKGIFCLIFGHKWKFYDNFLCRKTHIPHKKEIEQQTIKRVLEIIGEVTRKSILMDENCYKTEYLIITAIRQEFGVSE
jgi:hypothetical protein